jgi:hypothetical protein
MQILSGFIYIFIGVFWIWLGAFQVIVNMAPTEIGVKFAEAHGAWVRENVFKLPPAKEKTP